VHELLAFAKETVWPWLRPEVTSNLIALFAIIFAALSYRLSKSNAKALDEARMPEVITTASAIQEHQGWIRLQLMMRNHLPNYLDAGEIRIQWPLRAVGMIEREAMVESDKIGGRKLAAEIPRDKAKRRFSLGVKLAPVGTVRSQFGLSPGSTEYVGVYVFVGSSPWSRSLRFAISFSLRKTDVRLFRRIVIKQRIELPKRQAS
jgi:hypothetical protein